MPSSKNWLDLIFAPAPVEIDLAPRPNWLDLIFASAPVEVDLAPRPRPVGFREVVIEYRVHQITSAPDHALDKVIERFKKEVDLQFGSSVDVHVVGIDGTEWEPEAASAD